MSIRQPRFYIPLVIALLMLPRLWKLSGHLDDLDSWRQTDTASIAHHFLSEPNIFYPRVFWGAPGPGYVEAEFQLYPFTISLLYRIFGENPLIGRLLSVFLGALTCFVFYIISRRFVDEIPALIALAIFAFAPLFFRYSRQFMPESTALLFYMLALCWFLEFLDRETWKTILISASCMCLAILVKPTTLHLGLVLIIMTIWRWDWKKLFDPKLLAFAAIALLPSIAYYAHAAALHREYGNTFGVISGGDSKWATPAMLESPRFYWDLFSIDERWILGPALILAVAGTFLYRRPMWSILISSWAATLFVYYLIAGRYTGVELRGLQYHLFAVPLFALATAGGIAQFAPSRNRIIQSAVIGVILLTLGYEAWKDRTVVNHQNSLYRDAGIALANLSQREDYALVLSYDEAGGPEGTANFEQPDVFFHAKRWGRSLGRDQQHAADLRKALGFGAKWFVNFKGLNKEADSSYMKEITATMVLEAEGDNFEIYRVTNPAANLPAASATASGPSIAALPPPGSSAH